MKNRENRNIKVIAEHKANKDGFDIYLDFSGKREYLVYHRHNGLLYGLLKDGQVVEDMRRWKPSQMMGLLGMRVGRTGASRLYDVVSHLVLVIDDYLTERNDYLTERDDYLTERDFRLAERLEAC